MQDILMVCRDAILDTLIDSAKMLPFLFVAYFLIEFFEHRSSNKIQKVFQSKKYGVLGGALLGCFPQCGFSVAAANLYAGKIITAGTLIAVFISTSDEAIPIFLSNPKSIKYILPIILCKILIAFIAGYSFDFIFKSTKKNSNEIVKSSVELHTKECCCNSQKSNIFIFALKRTLNIFVFIVVTMLILNLLIAFIGEDRLSTILMTNTVFQPALAALIGLIPNCAASIVLTELYISGTIGFGSVIAGLCSGAGIGMLILFKSNKNVKQNFAILAYLYFISALFGTIIQFMGK